MGSTSLTSEMTSAINYVGAGVESQGRVLRSTVRQLTSWSAEGVESSRALTRDIPASPLQLLNWVATAFVLSASFLRSETAEVRPAVGRVDGDFLIVDKSVTRC